MSETNPYRIDGIRVPVDAPDAQLRDAVAKRLESTEFGEITILRRSIDARGRGKPRFELVVRVELADPLPSLPAGVQPWQPPRFDPMPLAHAGLDEQQVVIVGAGPCGLFAAIGLAERGIQPIILDRGAFVESRAKDVSRLMGKGALDPDSNLCYGEGGAGTFSDGKLYTRIGGKEVTQVIHKMVELGAPPAIAIDRRPHLGTDRLIRLLKGIRAHLVGLGARFEFRARVEQIVPSEGKAVIRLHDGRSLDAHHLVLAPGHSARALYRHLRDLGVGMEAKQFAVGFRAEHPQALIDDIQYGRWAHLSQVPAADYRVAFNRKQGGEPVSVYSFCMCPGGSVVPTATKPDEVSVNGMSHAARSGHYANSAVVTPVHPGELADDGDPLLAGVRFQERAERAAFALGGGEFRAPAARLLDYLAGKASSDVRRTTYRRGVTAADLAECFPSSVHQRLRAGLNAFDQRLRGFSSEDAVLIGVETRTSAPIRLIRSQACRSVTHEFLYPAGEGAGYAGGIASAAVDGLRIARSILAGE